ncbi:hypothetical protein T4D_16699 [Trichinella pseudospiralis]|uniref:Uncharacterized protein n=1 Tax=Trichinella pseudospiralis TaxID=6337 RepID=A0A0V1FB01_TRIPS|nr:hypothetical protein T4D_16699 [Trichinella pseudospiralis]
MRAIETLALAFIGIAGGTGGAAGDCLHFAPDETGKKIFQFLQTLLQQAIAMCRGMSSAVLVEMHIKHTNEPLPSKVAALIDWLVDEMLNRNYFDVGGDFFLFKWQHQFGIKRKKQVSFETAEQEGRGSESEQANESVCALESFQFPKLTNRPVQICSAFIFLQDDHLVLDLNQLNGGQNYFKVEQVTSLYEQQQH